MEINDFARMNYERARKNDRNNVFDADYYAKALVGEIGEFFNILKKIERDHFGDCYTLELKLLNDQAIEEAVDTLTYSFLLVSELLHLSGKTVEQALMEKYEKVNRRLEAGGFHARPEEG